MHYLSVRLFLMALALAIFQVGPVGAAESDILQKMQGKSVVFLYTFTMYTGDNRKLDSLAVNVYHFAKNGDVFSFHDKKTGRKIKNGSMSAVDKDGYLKYKVNNNTITLTESSKWAVATNTNTIHISGDSCRASKRVVNRPGKRAGAHSFRCQVIDGRYKNWAR